MGFIVLIVFLVALAPALIFGLFIRPKNQKEWFCTIAITILVGGFSWVSMTNLNDPGSSAKGFYQVLFYIALFALSPSIGMIFSKLIALFDR